MATFLLDTMSVNVAFQSTLSSDIVAEHLEFWSRVRFIIMSCPICYELSEISIALKMFLKGYSSKLFPSFKAPLEQSFSRIMYAHMP